jgi:hypothetical protein
VLKLAGNEPYRSAATGRLDGLPDRVYAYFDGIPFEAYYCESCARLHADGIDTSRSVTQFYADTAGEKQILTYESKN